MYVREFESHVQIANWCAPLKIFSGAENFVLKALQFEIITYVPWYDTDRTENGASNNSYIVESVFMAVVTSLPSCCLETLAEYT
jgi:hypothetical protein